MLPRNWILLFGYNEEVLSFLGEDAKIDSNNSNKDSLRKKRKRSKRFPIYTVARTAFQILFFVWLPSLYFSAFSALVEFILSIVQGTISWAGLWPSMLPLLAVVPVTILAGRYFCGWMCAFGSLTDWMFRLFSRLNIRKLHITRKADRLLKCLKYIILLVLLGLGWLAGSVSLSAVSPWDVFGMLFTVGAVPAVTFVLKSLLPGLVLLILILLVSAFSERFFCRYLCPMGAFFALTSGAKMSYISKPREGCGKCRICTNNCAMGIPLSEMDQVKSGECIGCMKCVEVCPRKNVRVQLLRTPVIPIVISAVMVCIVTGTLSLATALTEVANRSGASNLQPSASITRQTSADVSTANPTATDAVTTPQETTAASLYMDGTYRGVGTGYRGGTTKIDVTITGGQITDISVVSYQDDYQFFDKAFSKISQNVVNLQSAAVDTVSHATYSSEGIIAAVKDALNQAKK